MRPRGRRPGAGRKHKVAPGLSVASVAIHRLTPYAKNPRKNDAAVAKVAASLREYGWRQPIVVDEHMVVLAGHTRLLAAKSLGMASVPVHVAAGLTSAQARAFRLADNRTAQEAEWDDALLSEALSELRAEHFDLGLTGFDDDELERLLNPPGILPGADLDDAPAPPKNPVTKRGDRITLGRHALVCGDATDTLVWDALLDGRQAGMIWTDPPYGVSYGAKNKMLNKRGRQRAASGLRGGHCNRIETEIEGDTLDDGALGDLLSASLGLAWANSTEGASWYVAAPGGPMQYATAKVLHDLGVWRQTLQWVKNAMVIGRSDYHGRHETIFYGWKGGAAHIWEGDRSQTTVLEFDRPRKNELHPTMKPVTLVAYCIGNSSKAGAIVADPFAGSGSTLMACEATGRSSALIELSPAYCDVIVQRWEAATGQKAVRPNG